MRRPAEGRALRDKARERLRQFQRARGLDPGAEDERTDREDAREAPQPPRPVEQGHRGEEDR